MGHPGGHLGPDFMSESAGSFQKCQSLDPSQTKWRGSLGLGTRHHSHLKLLWVFLTCSHGWNPDPDHIPLQADGETGAWRCRGLTQGPTGPGGFLFFNFYIYFYFWLRWVFVAVHGLFSSCDEQGLLFVAVCGLLLLQSTGSRCSGFNSSGARAQ